MRGITKRLSLFIMITTESFRPRWLSNGLAWHTCWRHNIRNWIVWQRKLTSGSKTIVSSWSYLEGEQAVPILTTVQTGLARPIGTSKQQTGDRRRNRKQRWLARSITALQLWTRAWRKESVCVVMLPSYTLNNQFGFICGRTLERFLTAFCSIS